MTTLFRLLKFVRCLNAASPKTRLTAVNFENLSVDALLYPQAVFLTNGYKNYVSATDAQPRINNQDMDIDQKMTLLNKEITTYGRITKFNIEDILKDIQKTETVTSMQGLFLLRCCTELIADKSPALRKELGEEIWTTLNKLGVEFDVSHYNVLLSIYLENEYDFSPLDFLEEMLDKNVKPNRVTFQRLIQQFCNQGKITEANQLMEHMKNYQIPVNEEVLTSFIWGHAMINNMDAAHEILKHMETLEIIPTIRTYSTLMYAYAINGDIDSIRKILADCKDKDIWVPDKVILKVVYHLSLNGFTEFVDEILSMTNKGTLYVKDANQMMYKLVEKQQESVAFKIFQTLPKDAMNRAVTSGNFFIQTLINFQTPIDKSVEYCRIMAEEGINQRSFLSAINKSIANDMYDSSITFMKAWKDLGGQVREHYFYPIFKAYGESGQWEGIEKVLQKMTLEFNLFPSVYTLKSHILPYMQSSADDALASLVNVHVEYHVALNAILLHLLSENKIREANKFLTNYNTLCKMGMIKYNLLQAFKNTEDAPSFVSILHLIYKGALDEKNNTQYTTIENRYLAQQFIESCITEAIDFISPNNKYLLVMFFRTLVDKGLSISPKIAKEVEDKLKDYLTKEIANALNIMKSGELVPKPILRDFSVPRIKKYTDIEKLESMAKVLTITNNKAAMTFKKSLLISYCKALNEQKVEEILEEFEVNNIPITNWTYVSLITMYLNLQKVDKAEFWLCKCKKMNPTFKLYQDMNLKLVTALVENGEIEKAQEYLTWPTWPSQFSMLFVCRKLLDTVSKQNDTELLYKFFDLLVKHNYTNNMHDSLFSSFIQLHLDRNDPAAALQNFESLYKTYKKAPCRVELMKIFIKNGDNDSLERVKTICKSIVGETETNFLVAMAYLENNDLKTTRDIIKNDCAELYEENVIYFAENYYQNGLIDYLERLFEVLNTLKFDVERLCVLLLKSYSMQKEWKKGYNLWMRMQKDDIKPSNSFINCLNLILKEKNELGNDSFQKFNIAIRNGNYKAAKEMLNSLPLVYKSDCYSILCKKYGVRNNIAQVMDLWQELTEVWHLELDLSVAEYILNKLVKEKDISSIEKIESYLSARYKRQLKYNYYLSQVYLQTGSWNIYLKKLETKLANASVTWLSLDFHNKTVVYSLIKYPELIQQFECLAYKFTEKRIWGPIQALWIYYFLQNNTKADEVWIKYIKSGSSSYWLDVLDFSQCKNNADAYLKIADLVKKSSIRKNLKFSTYSKIIRECMNLDDPKKYEYALRCLKSAMQEFPMEEFDVNLLADLQTGLENSGIPWPWTAKLDNMDEEVRKRMIRNLLL